MSLCHPALVLSQETIIASAVSTFLKSSSQPEMSEEEARAKDRERWQDVVNSADELQEALKRLEYVEAVLTLACH